MHKTTCPSIVYNWLLQNKLFWNRRHYLPKNNNTCGYRWGRENRVHQQILESRKEPYTMPTTLMDFVIGQWKCERQIQLVVETHSLPNTSLLVGTPSYYIILLVSTLSFTSILIPIIIFIPIRNSVRWELSMELWGSITVKHNISNYPMH
jgi:hypothetical protein